jgi:phospho-N-acetylmuramoyl-pentapeptide-transferase
MFYHLSIYLQESFSAFNIFKYITFRCIASFITSFLIVFLFGDVFIKWLKSKQKHGQPIREDGPDHLIKKGTPTMGGGLILLSLTASTILWAKLTNEFIWITLILTLIYGAIGAYDDYLKLSKNSSKGLSGSKKLILQITIAMVATVAISYVSEAEHVKSLTFPFFKNAIIHWENFFYLFSVFVIVGSSNAVNLTDGLDGLAIVPVMMVGLCFTIISYVIGNAIFSNYLQLPYVPNTGEIAIFCSSLVGAGLGFLWYNAPPAKIFMGDTGSLAAGGAVGTISIITKHEIVLAIVGGVFVVEALSVILQVFIYKKTKKRFFLMAPIHHHFEKKGWAEPTIVIRFWIISALLALIGLSTLKLR